MPRRNLVGMGKERGGRLIALNLAHQQGWEWAFGPMELGYVIRAGLQDPCILFLVLRERGYPLIS